jgi:hypothetical protein
MPLQRYAGQLLWDGANLYNECCCGLPEICTECLDFDDGQGGEYGWLQDEWQWFEGADSPPNPPIPCGWRLNQTLDQCIKLVKKPFQGNPPVFQGYEDIVINALNYEYCGIKTFPCGGIVNCYHVAYFKLVDPITLDTFVVSVLLNDAVSGFLGFGCDIDHEPVPDCEGICCDCDTKTTCADCLDADCVDNVTCGWVYTTYIWDWMNCELTQDSNADFCVDRSLGWETDIGLFEYCGSTYIDPFDNSSSSSSSEEEGSGGEHSYRIRWFKYEVPAEKRTYIVSLLDDVVLCGFDVGIPVMNCIVPECSSSSSSSSTSDSSSSSSSSTSSTSSSSSEHEYWLIDGTDLIYDGADQLVDY